METVITCRRTDPVFEQKGDMMNNDAGNNQSMDLKERQFSLVLSDQKIRLNRAGAKTVARLACETAVLHSSPPESDKQYAIRLATFMCGFIASQCDGREQQMSLFIDFLEKVYSWLSRGCRRCEGTHHWHLFHDSNQGTKEIQKADLLDNI